MPRPTFTSLIQSQEQTAGQEITRNINNSISVLCTGVPQSQWLKDGDSYYNSTTMLFIPPVAENDTGFYQCLAIRPDEPEVDMTNSSQMFYALIQGIVTFI